MPVVLNRVLSGDSPMISSMKDYLPELDQFTRQLANDYSEQHLTWELFRQGCDAFYRDEMMRKIDSVARGWIEMASYRNGATLYHVTSVLVALYLLPEYQSASARQQRLMEWMVLFHDIAKVPIENGHDYIHGFKSSAVAGKAIANVGFPLKAGQSEADLDNWYDLSYNAIRYDDTHGEYVQDNTQLPDIIQGLGELHSADAYCIVTAILFHISIKTDPDYPIPAPLSDKQIQHYITPDSLPIIKAMYLVDNDGWCLFDKDRNTQQHRRQQTLAVFEQFVTPLVLST